MKTTKQGLQKLTEKKIADLLGKTKITHSDIEKDFSFEEKKILGQVLTKKINESQDFERDMLLEQIEDIIPTDTKNQLWENNHYQIMASMSKLIEEYGKMPTKNQIAADCKLSRQTIHKHLSSYSENPIYEEQIQQFKFMSDRVLAKVIKAACQGDIKAARLYFDIMGNQIGQASNKTLIKNQNNYIQINGRILSQNSIKLLNPKQLSTIETILEKAIPPQKVLE